MSTPSSPNFVPPLFCFYDFCNSFFTFPSIPFGCSLSAWSLWLYDFSSSFFSTYNFRSSLLYMCLFWSFPSSPPLFLFSIIFSSFLSSDIYIVYTYNSVLKLTTPHVLTRTASLLAPLTAAYFYLPQSSRPAHYRQPHTIPQTTFARAVAELLPFSKTTWPLRTCFL